MEIFFPDQMIDGFSKKFEREDLLTMNSVLSPLCLNLFVIIHDVMSVMHFRISLRAIKGDLRSK